MLSTGVSAYANVQARIRAMIGRLLSPAIFTRLNSCADLSALLPALIDTDYGSFITETGENSYSSRRIAYQIRKKMAQAFISIIKNAPDFAKPLISQLFRLYEVDNLKAILRGIQIGESWEKIRFMLFPMESFPTIPSERLVSSGDIERAIDILRETPYHRALSQGLARYLAENSLFPLEVALDLNYWQVVWQLVNELPHNDREIAQKIIGMYIDKNNLTWAARYHLYHNLSDVEIINYTLPFGYKIDDAIIRAVASGQDFTGVVSKVYPQIALMLETGGIDRNELPRVEIILNRLILSVCRSMFVGNNFNIGLPLAFLFILEFEIQDLTLLIEAKSLGIKPDRYQDQMVNAVLSPAGRA